MDNRRGSSSTSSSSSSAASGSSNAGNNSAVEYGSQLYRLHQRVMQAASPASYADIERRAGDIHGLHDEIQEKLSKIQAKTQQTLQDQERDLIKAFRAHLAQVPAFHFDFPASPVGPFTLLFFKLVAHFLAFLLFVRMRCVVAVHRSKQSSTANGKRTKAGPLSGCFVARNSQRSWSGCVI